MGQSQVVVTKFVIHSLLDIRCFGYERMCSRRSHDLEVIDDATDQEEHINQMRTVLLSRQERSVNLVQSALKVHDVGLQGLPTLDVKTVHCPT